jgi:GNAT superfamily N-acetyltransferase
MCSLCSTFIAKSLMNQYRFQKSFADDATLSDRLFNLLEIVFPEIKISDAAQVGRMLGASWESASTPFIRLHDNVAISHVGVLEIPMQLMGQNITVGGIHAVSTHPEFRRRGYYREIMEEVLDYCQCRYDTLVLTTAQPELYQPFGFRVVGEHIFITKCDSVGSQGFRLIDTFDTSDVKLLHRLLETREPVSNIVGIVKEKAVFCVNEGKNPLYYAPDLDVIICMEIKDTKLQLFDVVGTKICTLAEILERIEQPIQEVAIYFSPDRLKANVEAFSHILDRDSLLMVRGNFAAENEKFMLPRSARC